MKRIIYLKLFLTSLVQCLIVDIITVQVSNCLIFIILIKID